MFLVEILKPETIVELGTHFGVSYCAFCQAVDEVKLDTRCYAIDTWKGDAHTGFYGPEVLADLRAYHDPLYGSFSTLIQSTFDEALQHFADGTIDLLHIDGYHTYEAIKHDFESWLPKVSSHGVILIHDTSVRDRDFGVRTFWDEAKSRYPHFEFLHCNGLGILAVGVVRSKEVRELLGAPDEEVTAIRDFFFEIGHKISVIQERDGLDAMIRDRDKLIKTQDSMIRERDNLVKTQDAMIRERDDLIKTQDSMIRERDNLVKAQKQELVFLQHPALVRLHLAIKKAIARMTS
jgi:hypothetical protein